MYSKEYIRRKARDYAFNYYLRKGVQIDAVQLENGYRKYSTEELGMDAVNAISYLPPELIFQIIEFAVPGGRWNNFDFIRHFYIGNGRAVTLEEMGHLQDVIDVANVVSTPNFKEQIKKFASEIPDGHFVKTFENFYGFKYVQFSHGDAVLKGIFNGEVKWISRGVREFTGVADIEFSDKFEDPVDYRETVEYLNSKIGKVRELVSQHYGIELSLLSGFEVTERLIQNSNIGGTPYDITGKWSFEISGDARKQ